jgi:hypothetical protein
MIQYEFLNHPDQVSDGVKLKEQLETHRVYVCWIKNWGHEHSKQQDALKPVPSVSKVHIHRGEQQTNSQHQGSLNNHDQRHQEQVPTQSVAKYHRSTAQHTQSNTLIENGADNQMRRKNNGWKVQLLDQVRMLCDGPRRSRHSFGKGHPCDHSTEEKQRIVGPPSSGVKLHTNQNMEDKGVGHQLKQRRDDCPKETDGASGVPVPQILENKGPHQPTMLPQFGQATRVVSSIDIFGIDRLECGTWLAEHTSIVSRPTPKRRTKVEWKLPMVFHSMVQRHKLQRLPVFTVTMLVISLGVTACQDHKVTAFNSEPFASISSHQDGDELVEGTETEFIGIVTDDDDSWDELSTTWRISDRDVCIEAQPESDGSTRCTLTMEPDDISGDVMSVSLIVTDPRNANHTTRIDMDPVANMPPTVMILAPIDGARFYSDQPITLEGWVDDGEDQSTNLLVSWESSIDGVLPLETTAGDDGSILDTTFFSQGNHTLILWAEDLAGRRSSDTISFQVGDENEAPLCTISSPDNDAVYEEDATIEISGTATDPDIGPEELIVTGRVIATVSSTP